MLSDEQEAQLKLHLELALLLTDFNQTLAEVNGEMQKLIQRAAPPAPAKGRKDKPEKPVHYLTGILPPKEEEEEAAAITHTLIF